MQAPDEFDDELTREVALISGSIAEPMNKQVLAKPFCRMPSDSMVIVLLVGLGSLLIPLFWSSAGSLVFSLLWILVRILSSSSVLVFATLGWGLSLYPIVIYLGFAALYRWLNSFSQANQVELLNDGLLVRWPTGRSKMLRWTDITSAFLFCPHQSLLPENWLVGFGTSEARPVNLRMPVVSERGMDLVALMKKNCPWVSIDPDLIELWEPAIVDSHTELWLKSLSKAPREEELLPLMPGVELCHGRYLIISRIGVGGQGTAYLVKDKKEEKDVVVKETLFPVFVDLEVRAQAEERFKQELALLGRLCHEQVVRLLDSFVDEYRGYLVLDYIDGVSLRQQVKLNGAMDEESVKSLALQMCKILTYLHSLSPPVVHRDFTPDNLILDKNGKLILIDFNVAREMESTKTATVVGKHAYIPPEQFRAEADTRSDIYAYGATLYFLLTGEDPEPISESHPAEKLPQVSKELDEIVARSTRLELDERFQTADEVLKHLS